MLERSGERRGRWLVGDGLDILGFELVVSLVEHEYGRYLGVLEVAVALSQVLEPLVFGGVEFGRAGEDLLVLYYWSRGRS